MSLVMFLAAPLTFCHLLAYRSLLSSSKERARNIFAFLVPASVPGVSQMASKYLFNVKDGFAPNTKIS